MFKTSSRTWYLHKFKKQNSLSGHWFSSLWSQWSARWMILETIRATISICSETRKSRNELWFPMPTQLFMYGQWWSNLSTQWLHMAQCRDRGVRKTSQSGHISHEWMFYKRSMNLWSGLRWPGSFMEAIVNAIRTIGVNAVMMYAMNDSFWSKNIS